MCQQEKENSIVILRCILISEKSKDKEGYVLESVTYSISKPDPRLSQMRHYSN